MTSERRKQGTLQKGKKDMHIKDWPEGDRPREMLLEKGPEALSDAALLAILTVEDTHPFCFLNYRTN